MSTHKSQDVTTVPSRNSHIRWVYLSAIVVVGSSIGLLYYFSHCPHVNIDDCDRSDRTARIHPDYTGIVIPPNIAPLRFVVDEPAAYYYLRITSERSDEAIDVYSRDPCLEIPLKPWQGLLRQNPGGKLYFDICTSDNNGRWTRFQTITNTIADSPIDPYVVYRKICLSVSWCDIGTYQRNLTNFDESPVLHNSTYTFGCAHCHSFLNNDPDNMLMQIRSLEYGTPMLTVRSGQLSAVNTKTRVTSGKCGFAAWHPSGSVIAFAVNHYCMLYHSAAVEVRDVFDRCADLALYLADSNSVISTSAITDPNRLETFPQFSPDGRYLYFCSAPQVIPQRLRYVLCDLMRIGYDIDTNEWGALETVLTAKQVGGSITQPRFSPDGRYILLSVSEYSDFPIHQSKCDLFLFDTQSGSYSKLPISSDRNDSWHGFSSNGRWIVFNSKRIDGRYSRPFFSYFDTDGNAHKPFVMPQRDPSFYDSLTLAYNMPELIKSPIKITQKQFSRSIVSYKNTTAASAVTGATPGVAPPESTAHDSQSPWSATDIRE